MNETANHVGIIETGVQAPTRRHPVNRKYPFDKLAVGGDSFFLQVDRDDEQGKRRVRSAATAYGKAHGLKFLVRVSDRNGVWGMRVWRIE